ncbi:MAG TPA: hypothetical protein VF516_03375 [Kofleriaceae bacterium]
MIDVPQDTPEKPLTAIDYIAALQSCEDSLEVGIFREKVPLAILHDKRFKAAVQSKLSDIDRRKAA